MLSVFDLPCMECLTDRCPAHAQKTERHMDLVKYHQIHMRQIIHLTSSSTECGDFKAKKICCEMKKEKHTLNKNYTHCLIPGPEHSIR